MATSLCARSNPRFRSRKRCGVRAAHRPGTISFEVASDKTRKERDVSRQDKPLGRRKPRGLAEKCVALRFAEHQNRPRIKWDLQAEVGRETRSESTMPCGATVVM